MPTPRETIKVIAHRGASADVPEHTLAAYRKAIEDGADGLECDVRLTSDGHLVCVHDRRVNRTSNGRGAVSALELADLASLDFGSWKDTTRVGPVGPGAGLDTAVPVPPVSERPQWDAERTSVLTLERLLELVSDAGRRVELAIETKHPTRWAGQVEERLMTLLDRFGLAAPASAAESPVRVMSFSARSLHRVRAASPHLPTVQLMQFVGVRHRDGAAAGGGHLRAEHPHPARPPLLCGAGPPGGNRVHVWTVDDPADVALCADLGVDAVITNRPRAVLEQLGRG
ncbi:glycerophosphodiester phosphodiesterase family protein [Actinomadura keratinilytica]